MSQSADTATAPASPHLTVTTRGSDDGADSPADSLEDATEFFEDRIWHNHLVCSNCFTRVKRTASYTLNDWGDTDQHDWRTDDGLMGETSEFVRRRNPTTVRDQNNAVVGVRATEPVRSYNRHEHRTTCGHCGSVRAIKQYESLTEQEAVDRVPALAERLREQGDDVNTDAMYDAVRRLKTDEDFTTHDKEIFAVAAALGVDKA